MTNQFLSGDDVYVINGRKTDFEATLVRRGERSEVRLRPDHRTIHEFGLVRADRASRDSQGMREFSAAVFSLSQNLPDGGVRIATEMGVTFITEQGEEHKISANTTDGGNHVIKTFSEAERISAEEEEKEMLKWLIPNISSG